MKRWLAVACVMAFAVFELGSFSASPALAQGPSFEELAQRVVSTSAKVKAGDVVVIYGGKHTIPLMEALAIEVNKAGGMAQMFLRYSDRVYRSFLVDVAERYLEQPRTYFAEWLKQVDVWIILPGVEDPRAAFADVPAGRFAKANNAFQVLDEMLNASGVREVFIGYPTKEVAAINRIDFATLEKMHWDAVNADYDQISAQGKQLKQLLQGAKVVKVTSPSGTNLTFSVGDRPVFVNDGIVTEEEAKGKLFLTRNASLPGGTVFVAPPEISANGKVVVPRTLCRFGPLTGVSFEFQNGKLANFKAEKGGECFEDIMGPYTGPKDMFGWFEIGLNPALKVVEDPGDYRPGNAAGMVWISIGNNEMGGGTNKTQGGFGFPIVKATVEIDGKVVVKDGRLVF